MFILVLPNTTKYYANIKFPIRQWRKSDISSERQDSSPKAVCFSRGILQRRRNKITSHKTDIFHRFHAATLTFLSSFFKGCKGILCRKRHSWDENPTTRTEERRRKIKTNNQVYINIVLFTFKDERASDYASKIWRHVLYLEYFCILYCQ